MAYKLTSVDQARLRGVHPDLQKVVRRLAETTTIPFMVLEGLRTIAQQKKNVANGVSWTLRSRHLTGHAVDLVPLENNKPSWAWPLYYKLAPQVKAAAKSVGVPIEWGGDWSKNKDGPHWQLPWKQYPTSDHADLGDIPHERVDGSNKLTIATAGAGGTATLATFPSDQVVNALVTQQDALSSTDITRMVVSGCILLLTLGLIWWQYRASQH